MPAHKHPRHGVSHLEQSQHERQKLYMLKRGLARLDGLGIDEEQGISAEFKLKKLLGIKLESHDDIVSKYFQFRQDLADHGYPNDRREVLKALTKPTDDKDKSRK